MSIRRRWSLLDSMPVGHRRHEGAEHGPRERVGRAAGRVRRVGVLHRSRTVPSTSSDSDEGIGDGVLDQQGAASCAASRRSSTSSTVTPARATLAATVLRTIVRWAWDGGHVQPDRAGWIGPGLSDAELVVGVGSGLAIEASWDLLRDGEAVRPG